MASFALAPEPLAPADVPGMANYGIDIDDHLAASNPALNTAKVFMADLVKSAEGFNVRRATVDEEITATKNLTEIAKAADILSDKVSRDYAKATAEVAAGKAQAEAAVNAKIALTPTGNASEIRLVFRSMSPSERTEAMATAFKNDDKEVLAALVNVPDMLHGCNPEQLGAHYEAYKQNVAFGEYRVLNEYNKAARYLDNCNPGILRWRADIYKGTTVYTAKRAQQEAIMKSYGFSFGSDD